MTHSELKNVPLGMAEKELRERMGQKEGEA
jgi:hypothetical protein